MDAPQPPSYTEEELREIAADWDTAAVSEQHVADGLAADGHTEAAGIWSRNAQAARELAAAAREGSERYVAVIHGWT